jgi:hypothetical protein
MDADFSTQALHYQTTALRNTRLAQDASLVRGPATRRY